MQTLILRQNTKEVAVQGFYDFIKQEEEFAGEELKTKTI